MGGFTSGELTSDQREPRIRQGLPDHHRGDGAELPLEKLPAVRHLEFHLRVVRVEVDVRRNVWE